MTKNRTSAICCPSLEEMPLIHNFPLLWHHGVLLNSELWIVCKELYSFIKRRPAFHCICQALCWVCSFFFSDRGAGCKYYDSWLSDCAMGVLAQHGVSYAGIVCDEVSLIMEGLHSSCLCCISLHVSTFLVFKTWTIKGIYQVQCKLHLINSICGINLNATKKCVPVAQCTDPRSALSNHRP